MTIKTAMLLSAGKGERLQPLTFTTPKPLLPIHGKPFIVHHIEKLANAGIKKIVINVSYMANKIIDALDDGSTWNINIVYSHEIDPLGAGGGVKNALPLLGKDHFLLVSSDVYSNFDFNTLIQQDWQDTLVHAVLTEKHAYDKGDFNLQDSRLIFTDQPNYIFGSIAVFNPYLFETQTAGFSTLMPAFTHAIQANQATGEYYQNILNINTLEEYRHFSGSDAVI